MHIIPASTVKHWPLWAVFVGGQSSGIFCRDTYASDLRPIKEIENPDAGLREQDRVTDDGGRAFDSAGHGRHRMAPSTTQKRHQQQDYAREVADHINRAHAAGQFGSLFIAAPPKLLGDLRASLNDAAHADVVHEIAKDLSAADNATLQRTINDAIRRKPVE